MSSNRKELYNLSNTLVEVFVAELLSKHKVNKAKANSRISNEQREKLQTTINNLKEQVEAYLDKQTQKEVTENDQSTIQPESPLREMFSKRKQR
ncbi:hypothetical protein KHA96_09395 [Bacillus sp. FJAT-49711]|uniref:hypothetical protein n=1 Tax=Bacillus sp. FJAT-49711 TaxID=2833585 RepID=UPI001BC9C746|nr:hypothetical protein [Bacillus sp. FJAT-49711]MBS4218525.1 hypothetical protein [Bacillus sp. FJAT-49711]